MVTYDTALTIITYYEALLQLIVEVSIGVHNAL